MNEQARRKQAGAIVAVIGVAMVLVWLALTLQFVSWQLSDGVRIFLIVVGAPLVLAGTLVARRSPDAGPPA